MGVIIMVGIMIGVMRQEVDEISEIMMMLTGMIMVITMTMGKVKREGIIWMIVIEILLIIVFSTTDMV
jgi:hypothetical protein